MIFVTDADGKATYLSREWGDVTGQSLEDAIDDGWSKAVHPEDLDIVRTVVADATRARSEFAIRYRLLSPDGRSTWVSAGAVPSFGPPGRTFLGFFGSISLLLDAPAEGLTAGATLGRFSPPPPQCPDPGSVLEMAADHLVLAHALLVQDDGTSARAAVEAALHAVGRELAQAALAEIARGEGDRSVLH